MFSWPSILLCSSPACRGIERPKPKTLSTTEGLRVVNGLREVGNIDVKSYLKNKTDALNDAASPVSDFSVFDFNYIPEQPLMREEAKLLIDSILFYTRSRIPKNLAVIGSRGSGKTLLVRYLAKEIQKETRARMLYCNMRNHNTSYKAVAHLLGKNAPGGSLSELFAEFETRHAQPTVVVLDEIDLMSPKDRNKEILYLLSRSPHSYMVILLSNTPRFLRKIDASTRSSLQPQAIHFKDYDAQQVYEILLERARLGLRRHSEEDLRRIAALTTRNTNSDVRIAIKCLLYTATEPGLSIDAALERACRDISIDIIQDLNDKSLLILESLRRSRTQHAKDVYEAYVKLGSQYGEVPFSYMHYCNSLSYLQSCGLVLLAATKVGRTYSNRIHGLFDQEVMAETFRTRFGQ